MATVGKLLVELAASTAKFQTDLGRAASSAESASKRIGAAMSFVKGAVAGVAGAVSIGAFVNLIKGSIDAADHLNDLSKSTGITVEKLGGIGFAASQAGSDLDSAAAAFGKLNLRIAGAVAGNQEAAKAFDAIGISIADLKASTPDQVFAKLADKFASYEDGANKAALGNALFGKSYQGIIPLLDEGGTKLQQNIDYYKRYGGVTQEVAEKSDQFKDTLAKINLLQGAFVRQLTADMLPGLQKLADLWLENKEKGDQFAGLAGEVSASMKFLAEWTARGALGFFEFGRAVGTTAAQLDLVLHGEFRAARQLGLDFLEELKRRQQAISDVANAVSTGAFVGPPDPRTGKTKGQAPSLGSTDAADASRKILEGKIKAFEALIKSEQDILKDREHFLTAYYQDDELGIKEYFDTRQGIIIDALSKELAAYDGEIKVLRDKQKTATPKDRIELETQIADVVEKRAGVQREAAVKSIDLWRDEQKAAAAFRKEIEQISLAIIQLQGDQVTAAAAGFDIQNAQLQKRIDLEKQSSDDQTRRNAEVADARLAQLRTLTIAQAQLNQVASNFGDVLDRVGIAESRIAIEVATGNTTQLDSLNKLSKAHLDALPALEAERQAYLDLAITLGDTEAGRKALLFADQLKLKMEQLAATTDLVTDKFRGVFVSSLTDNLAAFASGTKTAKEAFRGFADDVVSQINRIAAQQLSESLFGKGGALGGVPSFFGKLFGSPGQDAGAIALTGSATALDASAVALTSAATAITAAAAASSTSSGASGLGGLLGSLFGGGDSGGYGQFDAVAGYAKGTNFAPGGMALVGERGPEIVDLPRGSRVTPNSRIGGRTGPSHLSIVVNVPRGTSGPSADQIAIQTGAAVQRALSRNG